MVGTANEPPWDNPESLDLLWNDESDSGHPFTKAALSGDESVVSEYTSKPTFDPSSKKSQHALLAACRAGEF